VAVVKARAMDEDDGLRSSISRDIKRLVRRNGGT